MDAANRYLRHLWQRSQEMFLQQDYPLAGFLAITLFEEVGKIGMGFGDWGKPSGKDFRNHRSKYRSAVGATLFVNSRVTRIYRDHEKRFAAWFKQDDLFSLRNRCLYLEHEDGRLVAPDETIDEPDVALLVCMAGEVLADIQGMATNTGPNECFELLAEVDRFRARTSLA